MSDVAVPFSWLPALLFYHFKFKHKKNLISPTIIHSPFLSLQNPVVSTNVHHSIQM
ncbi:hypothetical protein HanRHA438_Chr07g0292341 [Helianthus annuus]|uniref:Uncharacterized protein n=1 Tax=Helianthus annuus TaxID=4232 RepID=A0A251RT42_HELAN|nr:hypothetical protein HanXRQr2_Chr07g0281741 [Helianthus annuus]KAJ0730391.1 hypothetical protein HanOQP8_Chr07g0239461 [Helianthus annuus]KAJ0903669.1 hypothetical protein HanPSC8_Chr07g0272631 [Helianthus annuus]KAJ0906882.1 hypothetical protein HanRHA438_Chr07g0292341 [Helianthus annuus]